MWKLVVAFVIFAAVSLFVIMKAGDKIDMGGEQHSGDIAHPPAGAAAPAASAASAPAK